MIGLQTFSFFSSGILLSFYAATVHLCNLDFDFASKLLLLTRLGASSPELLRAPSIWMPTYSLPGLFLLVTATSLLSQYALGASLPASRLASSACPSLSHLVLVQYLQNKTKIDSAGLQR